MKTVAIIASAGRPAILRRTVEDILAQSEVPAQIILSTIAQEDWMCSGLNDPRIKHLWGRRGLPVQLNWAIESVPADTDVVFIFDDDVALERTYCAKAARWFAEAPDILAFDGEVVQDGGIEYEAATRLLAALPDAGRHEWQDSDQIYGCNMCARRRVFDMERFDENLSGYAWLFEKDWICRVKRRGRTGRVADCRIVHLMAQSGRPSGFRLGQMQILHPYYLWRKGSLRTGEILRTFIWRHLLINTVKSITGDPKVDRPGRLRGNLSGLGYVLRGRGTPKSAAPSDAPTKWF